ncbi:hypothetical protein ENUP19_0057G0048 [Entamoeba nuttalli]|uniref:diacylglycerol kinase (ATP) n=2 Tax=Entamoeba nuttalli TaxID=412467 RepID=K2GQB0_ENTNP|nr:diacylglycerol kinase, putative [Entamoeba nuttalli P19]EKE37088.1 diacylglycerol kinase, putative [Entamoeba nuttalli P19]|eukprot:XP_008860598.1 diacylglycerol kinase, putative [Entamoeba nuttalli P19]
MESSEDSSSIITSLEQLPKEMSYLEMMNFKRIYHRFEIIQTPQNVKCFVCGMSCNGKNVLKCDDCNRYCHEFCQDNVVSNCYNKNIQDDYQHSFEPSYLGGNCVVCGKSGGAICRCIWCSLLVHSACQPKLLNCCRQLMIKSSERTHYFINEGEGVCVVCKKEICQDDGNSFHCIYCKESIHEKCCCDNLERRCDCGKLAPYLIHPCEVIFKNRYLMKGPLEQPMFFIINELSGGKRSKEVISLLGSYFHPMQFINIEELTIKASTISQNNDWYSKEKKPIIVICGGDGSVESCLDQFGPFVTYLLLPYGTGNDLSLSLGYSPSTTLAEFEANPIDLLMRRMKDYRIQIDRWKVTKATYPGDSTFFEFRHFTNYLSIGIDAAVAQSFSEKREIGPCGRFINKCKYAMSVTALLDDSCKNIHNKIIVEVDGEEIDLPPMDCLIFQTTLTCYGGQTLWKNPVGFKEQRMDDGILEIMYIRNIAELGSVSIGVSTPTPLAQGKEIIITLKPNFVLPLQTDGEPFLLQNSVLHFYCESHNTFVSSHY